MAVELVMTRSIVRGATAVVVLVDMSIHLTLKLRKILRGRRGGDGGGRGGKGNMRGSLRWVTPFLGRGISSRGGRSDRCSLYNWTVKWMIHDACMTSFLSLLGCSSIWTCSSFVDCDLHDSPSLILYSTKSHVASSSYSFLAGLPCCIYHSRRKHPLVVASSATARMSLRPKPPPRTAGSMNKSTFVNVRLGEGQESRRLTCYSDA